MRASSASALTITALFLFLAALISAFESHTQPRLSDRVEKGIHSLLFGLDSLSFASNHTPFRPSSRSSVNPTVEPLSSGIIHPSFYPFLLPAMLYVVFSIFPRRLAMRAMDRPPRPRSCACAVFVEIPCCHKYINVTNMNTTNSLRDVHITSQFLFPCHVPS